jgi:hypothetical protein
MRVKASIFNYHSTLEQEINIWDVSEKHLTMSIPLGSQESFGIMEPSYIERLVSSGFVSNALQKTNRG